MLHGQVATLGAAMPIDVSEFEIYAAIIKSEQMDAADVPKFMEENPEFARWYAGKAGPISPPGSVPIS
jgi:hypothetical protein